MHVLIAMSFLFFGATEYEACKADGINDVKACAERTWENRQPLDYSKLDEKDL